MSENRRKKTVQGRSSKNVGKAASKMLVFDCALTSPDGDSGI